MLAKLPMVNMATNISARPGTTDAITAARLQPIR